MHIQDSMLVNLMPQQEVTGDCLTSGQEVLRDEEKVHGSQQLQIFRVLKQADILPSRGSVASRPLALRGSVSVV